MRGGGTAPAGESTDGTAQMSQARRTRRGRRRPDGQHHIVPDNRTQPVIDGIGAPRASGGNTEHSYITCVDYPRTRILALPYCSIYVRSFAERTATDEGAMGPQARGHDPVPPHGIRV